MTRASSWQRTYRPEGEEAVEPELVLVQNWLEELKARVPK